MTTLGRVLFASLLVASVVVGGAVVRARTPNLALEVTHFTNDFSPNGDGEHDVGRFGFFVRESDPAATVEIVDTRLHVVRTLYEGPLEANRPVSYTWNGRTNSGEPANRDERYQLRVMLPGADRDMLFPNLIQLREHASG